MVFEKNFATLCALSSREERFSFQDNLTEYSETLAEYLEGLVRLLISTKYLKLVAAFER